MNVSRARLRPVLCLLPLCAVLLLVPAVSCAGAAAPPPGAGTAPVAAVADGLSFPWREAGWDEREAAAHLLSRFTYGARPGDVDRVVAMGLERWFAGQLAADLPDAALLARERGIEVLALPGEEIARRHPPAGAVLRMAERDGLLGEDAAERLAGPGGAGDAEMHGDPEMRGRLLAYARERGLRGQRRLAADLGAWTLYRAVEGENQLREVMADFWANHFYVSLAKPEARAWVLPYVRDALRPRALGTFGELLAASARHPAMLLYLDNAGSTAPEGARTLVDPSGGPRAGGRRGTGRGIGRGRSGVGPRAGDGARRGGARRPTAAPGRSGRVGAEGVRADRRPRGLNENYARELLELHTLGVDGGYDQQDVVEVARAFTGWSALPPTAGVDPRIDRLVSRARAASRLGFVVDGGFVFRPDVHDAGAKRVLGERLAPGRGIEDGEEVLALFAAHPSTARHLAEKLAVRFVSDRPPAALVDRLAAAFTASGGDVRRVLAALAGSPEFWDPEARAAKIKSPFELVASALRATGARVVSPRGALEWVERMGQPLYAHPAPTGYPDSAADWVSAGALLERMRFGVALAGGEVAGVVVDERALAAAAPAGVDPGVHLGSPAFQRR